MFLKRPSCCYILKTCLTQNYRTHFKEGFSSNYSEHTSINHQTYIINRRVRLAAEYQSNMRVNAFITDSNQNSRYSQKPRPPRINDNETLFYVEYHTENAYHWNRFFWFFLGGSIKSVWSWEWLIYRFGRASLL
jgi:hypothetical protein